jgi:hypothetical protein
MAVWENIPECKRESINKSLYRWSKKERSEKRKEKIKRLYDKSER